ncbi:AAA family ATPase [archaeon]|jgi:pilus assembly protein CpaE|nr:AAA family ATPase [archaeon]MBT7128181.1 AAA family ATPase [archaeon]
MTNILSFVSIKGGVGKTTLALETAVSLAKHFDKKVLLVDANFSAPNIGLYLDLTKDYVLQDALNGTLPQNAIYEAHGIDIIPSSMHYHKEIDPHKLKKILQKYKSRYDFIILDTSPNYEELKPIIAASDKIFLVTSPDHVTLHTTLKAARIAKEQKTPIEGIIINKIRSPKHEYNLKEIETLSEVPVLAKIKDHKKMAEALHSKTPISVLDELNTISKEIKNFAAAIAGSPKKEGWFQKLLPYKPFVPKEEVNRQFYSSQV